MVAGSGPSVVEGREVFMGTFKGVKVGWWSSGGVRFLPEEGR